MFQIEGVIKTALHNYIMDVYPRERGGLIIDNRHVVPLPNHASSDSAFEFHLTELRAALKRYEIDHLPGEEIAERVVLWHSHPGGGVGPSREDMQNKTPLKYHLVIALVDGDLVPTWY